MGVRHGRDKGDGVPDPVVNHASTNTPCRSGALSAGQPSPWHSPGHIRQICSVQGGYISGCPLRL
jgi:hypothetical protein